MVEEIGTAGDEFRVIAPAGSGVAPGDFDYVIISHAPNDKVALAFLLGLGETGDLRTKTLKAYTRDQYEEIIKELR